MVEPVAYIVDDDQLVRSTLRRLFESVGISCRTFASPEEFLKIDRPAGPSCVVLDLRMSGMSGLEVQQQLVRRGLGMPVIFMTGHATVSLGVRAMKAGAQDFLEKPIDGQAMLDAVNLAIHRDRETRRAESRLAELRRRHETLTARERQIFKLVATGKLNKQIAYDLGTSEKTVKFHRAAVMQKMQADSLAALVRMAQGLGIPTDD